MENEALLEKLATQIGQTALVKEVYGEPVRAGEKTIIPVTEVAFGMGGGFGQKNKNGNGQVALETGAVSGENKGKGNERGAGGGGGMYVKPKGVYEITPNGTKFIPARSNAPLFIGLLIGFVIRGLMSSKVRGNVKFNHAHFYMKP